MSLTNTIVKQAFVADGVTASIVIPFKIIQSDIDEVQVYTRNQSVTPAVLTKLVAGVDYDLTGKPDIYSFNTTVTFRAGKIPAAGLIIWLIRELTQTQPLDNLLQNSAINLPNHETAYDRAVALIQQLHEMATRSLRLSFAAPTFSTLLPDPVANTIIGYNALGTALENKTVASVINLAGALAIANNLSDLSNVSAALVNLGISPLTVQKKVAFLDGQLATNVTGEAFDGSVYTSIVYEYEVIRGSAISTGRFSLQYNVATWGVVDGGYEGNPHGLSWSVSQVGSVGQLRIAASSSGGGNGTIKLKKHYFGV